MLYGVAGSWDVFQRQERRGVETTGQAVCVSDGKAEEAILPKSSGT